MREYHEVFGHELSPLPWEPLLSDYYTPNDEQHYRELGFIVLSMIGLDGSFALLREFNYITNCNKTTFWLPYMYRLNLQHLQPMPISFVIPNQLDPWLY